MKTLTLWCRKAKKNEYGMIRAPWWGYPPSPMKYEDISKDWHDAYYMRCYKRRWERDIKRAEKLKAMLEGKDKSKSNCEPEPILSNHPKAIKSREYRMKLKDIKAPW